VPGKAKILNQKPKILIIRPSALGDVARTTPCLVSLRRAYPGAQIDWLVGSAFIDAIRCHPALTHAIPFDRSDKRSVWPLLRRLRRAKYDLVFDLQGLARSGLFAWATRAQTRVGDANAREFGWLGLNRRHPVDPARHAIPRMTDLLAAEGIEVVHDLSLHVAPEDRAWVEAHSAARPIDAQNIGENSGGERYACVAPTAQWGCKCWPMDRYVQITERLLRHAAIDHAVVLAAPSENAAVRSAFADLLAEASPRVTAPVTTVGQSMALIENARLLVGNDSAPLHLAVGLGTPTVSLFGPTDPALVGPPPAAVVGEDLARRHRVLRAPAAVGQTFNYRAHRDDDTLIAELGLDAVWDAVDTQLDV